MKIDMKQPILDKNDAIARELRERFAEHHVYVVDLLASPGSGKTSTILATIDALRDEFNIARHRGRYRERRRREDQGAGSPPCGSTLVGRAIWKVP